MRPDRAPASWLAALACIALAYLPAPLAAQLAYDRDAVLAGQLWRLWSGHLVHFSGEHALLDVTVLLATGALAEATVGSRRLAPGLLLGAPAVSLGLLLAAPAMLEYRGASAIASMTAVAAAAQLWAHGGRWKLAVLLAGAGFFGKALCEAAGVALPSAALPDNVAVAWQAHLFGALCGLLLVASHRHVVVRDQAPGIIAEAGRNSCGTSGAQCPRHLRRIECHVAIHHQRIRQLIASQRLL